MKRSKKNIENLVSIKVKLHPTLAQQEYCNKLFGVVRLAYNSLLTKNQEDYKQKKTKYNFYDLQKWFYSDFLKNPDKPYINEHNTKVLKQSVVNFDNAMTRFFKKQGKYPVFKKRHRYNKAKFLKDAISKNNLKDGNLHLTRQLKDVKWATSEEHSRFLVDNRDAIQSITIERDKTGEWWGAILFHTTDRLPSKSRAKGNGQIGIDLGINTFAVLSNGEKISNPKFKRSRIRKIKLYHKRHSKKQKGSSNKEKARVKLAKVYKRMTNQKNDFLQNLSKRLVCENQAIAVEDLNVKGMMRNRKLSLSIQELSIGEFKRMLEYKSIRHGCRLVKVDRFFSSSKICNACGNKKDSLSLSEREYVCESCGHSADRDMNAAKNILKEGLRLLQEQGQIGVP